MKDPEGGELCSCLAEMEGTTSDNSSKGRCVGTLTLGTYVPYFQLLFPRLLAVHNSIKSS
jgi:hypothetical protein